MTFLADISVPQVLVAFLFGAAAAVAVTHWFLARQQTKASELAEQIIQEARKEAENLRREIKLQAAEEAAHFREETEQNLSARRKELGEKEERLAQRESLVNKQLEGFVEQEKGLRLKQAELHESAARLESKSKEIEALKDRRLEELKQLAQLSPQEAKQMVLSQVEKEALQDAMDLSKRILAKAKASAEEEARRIIGMSIQRHASDHTFETTTATVALKGDENKGRIIGREGRNIRAFEAATGITVLIDDTPNAVVLSGFDPVRREIAREAMQRLIHDGRIHPTRIEEVVNKVAEEMEESINRTGEEAVFRLNLPPLNKEIVAMLGKLRFRHSFSQNILDHSIEVAQIMGLLAGELGIDIDLAKRTGLLHDIGKAMNHETEGPHALVGAQFLKRHGEPEDVVEGVASHHDETPEPTLLGILTGAADAISASRPGARSETMTTYLKRLENLEQIGLSFAGVDKCFAVQAGRELRILVEPDKINDAEAYFMARKISRRIEEELQYPGQIRVTVIRETRCVEFAK